MTEREIEVTESDREPRRVTVDSVLEVGREVEGLLLSDEGISRHHARFTVEEDRLVVTDLGSTNGTTVNGVRIAAPTTLETGDVVEVGLAIIKVLAPPVPATPPTSLTVASAEPQAPVLTPLEPLTVPGAEPQAPVPTPLEPPAVAGSAPQTPVPTPPREPAPAAEPPPGAPPISVRPRPVLEELESRPGEAAVIRFRPGTAGERAAATVAHGARRARRRLAGLGSESWGVVPTICLVDPMPDPDSPGQVMTSGTIVDGPRNEIWMVVTSESPPEPLERPLALLFGNGFPAPDDIGPLLEGYGLFVSDAPDPDEHLRELDLPALGAAEGEVASAMALSFVRYLVASAGRDGFLRMLASAQPGRLDASAQEVFGAGMAALEERWRRKLSAGPPDVKTGQFLRLAARYLRPHARREAEMFVYMVLGLAFTVILPFVIRNLIDVAIPSGQFSKVLVLLEILTGAFIVSLLAGLRQAYLAAVVSGSVVRSLQNEMFAKLQALSQGWFGRHEQGDVLSRIFNDVGLLEQGLSQTLRNGLVQIMTLIVSAVVLVILDPLLALVVLATAPIIGIVYKSMAKGAQKRSVAVQEETGSVLSVASENYGAQSVVKAFGLQLREVGRFRRATDRLFDRQVKLQLFGGIFGLSVNMIVSVLQIVILGLGAWLILHHHLTIGGLMAFVSLMGQVLAPVTVLTGIGQQIQSATGALVRINEVLGSEPEVDEPAGAGELALLEHDIRLRDIGFSYTSERRTLEGVDIEIKAGQKVAFVGPSGAGKSSVLQLLMRFYDPDEGAVLFDGIDVRQVTVASLRAQLGVVFQDTFLFNATFRENIALGKPGASDAEIEEAGRAAELHDFIMTLPRGYDTLVGERGGRLSGGQRQRISIARALLRDPRVVLLDEATSALDPRTERMISDTLERVGQGRTTIAVTHRLTSITGYDRIFVLVAGRLVEQGTHSELVAAGGVYAQLWAEQTGGQVAMEAPFDAPAALAHIPLFTGLGATELADVASRLQASELGPGETVGEGSGRLMLVRQGRATVLVPDFTGQPVPSAELSSGDAFGLAALLGDDAGRVLQATEPVVLLVLDDQAIRGLAGSYPSVAAALEGAGAPAAAPVGGTRLTRLTMGPAGRPSLSVVGPPPDVVAGPSAEEIRRRTGTLRAVGQ